MSEDKDKFTLTPADAAAVDALLNGTPDAAPLRRQRARDWLAVLDASPMPEPAGDLATRTLAAVQADRLTLGRTPPAPSPLTPPAAPSVQPPGRWRRRLAEIGAMAIAATLLLFVALEGLGQARRSEARTACAGNLKLFANAFSTYSNQAGDGILPVLASPTTNWLTGAVPGIINPPPGYVAPGPQPALSSNASNLLPLITGNLLPPKSLFCAGAGLPTGPIVITADHMPDIGYSYRDMSVPDRPRWTGQTIILADKNPIFAAQIHPERADENSPNHDAKGTYVLRADSTVTWETHPNIGPNHDNIWTLTNGKDRLAAYTGHESPLTLQDVFVCP